MRLMYAEDDTVTEAAMLESEVAALMVESLHLDIKPADINPYSPLFTGEGLGLDSIDALELALAISTRYGFQLRSDDDEKHKVFANLRALSAHIEQHRTK